MLKSMLKLRVLRYYFNENWHFALQDPCFITNTTDYEPYDRLKNISGAVMWPDGITGVDDYKEDDGAMLGYVSN